MMRIEGRIALGLDEFMLRLGHLKVLVSILLKTSGNRSRIARQLAEALTVAVPVERDELAAFGKYLMKKRLCIVVNGDGTESQPHAKGRYAHLRVVLNSRGQVADIVPDKGPLRAWFQDTAIANSATRSKVGAVTVDTRDLSSKSGVSHLVDWAVISGIANRRLGLTAAGRALALVMDEIVRRDSGVSKSPYVIGHEKIVFGWLLFMADGDILARLIGKMAHVASLTKAEAMELTVELCEELRSESAGGRAAASVGAVRAVRDFQQDLGLGSRASARRTKLPSTVWHRVSSRLESLTDIGLLEKTDSGGVSREYEYCYRPTDALREASRTLGHANSPTEWVDTQLTAVLCERGHSAPSAGIGRILTRALNMCLGPTGVHIDSFGVVSATLASMEGVSISFAYVRERLVDATLRNPDVLRLSRGYSGSRAEFASVIGGKVDEGSSKLFGV